MLTTKHVSKLIDLGKKSHKNRQVIIKPNIVISYNTYMGGADLLDQSTSAYTKDNKVISQNIISFNRYRNFQLFRHLQSSFGN